MTQRMSNSARSNMQFGVDFGKRREAVEYMIAHCMLGVRGTTVDDGACNDLVVDVGPIDALRAVKGREQQAVDRHRQLFEKLRGIMVAGAFDDQRVPGVVEL